MPQANRLDLHRCFGIGLADRFHGTPWRVELEREPALKRQRLDVVIIEQGDAAAHIDPAALDLPDGLDNLRGHNLLRYKSYQEALDARALDEHSSAPTSSACAKAFATIKGPAPPPTNCSTDS